jgi:hypothetical protein
MRIARSIIFVNLVRVFELSIDNFPTIFSQLAIEARLATCMAGNPAMLFDLQHNYVGIAVKADFVYGLEMPRLFAFVPEFLT